MIPRHHRRRLAMDPDALADASFECIDADVPDSPPETASRTRLENALKAAGVTENAMTATLSLVERTLVLAVPQ